MQLRRIRKRKLRQTTGFYFGRIYAKLLVQDNQYVTPSLCYHRCAWHKIANSNTKIVTKEENDEKCSENLHH